MIHQRPSGITSATLRVEDFHAGDVVAVVENCGRSMFYALVIGPAHKSSTGPLGRVRVVRCDLLGRPLDGAEPVNKIARNMVLKTRDGKAV